MKAAPLPGAASVLYWGLECGGVLSCLEAADGGPYSLVYRGAREYRYPSRYRLDFLKTANGWKAVRIAPPII